MQRLSTLFKALADPTRLRIINLLLRSPFCVCEMERILGLPQPLLSRHLAYLRNCGLARQQLQFRITREVRTAVADLESADSRVTALRDSVAESERVLHDERLKFEAGRSVINFVLDAESALLTSQSLLSQAERSVRTAALALDLSMGRIDINRLP